MGTKETNKKKEKWIKRRHYIVRDLVFLVLKPYVSWKYRVKVEPFKEQGKRPYLILMNHQTAYDQFFIGIAFKGPVYYLATEDIFSIGWASSLIRWLVAPIPIKKQATDVTAVMNCIRVAKEGGTIAIAPEGNRTYSGRTCYISPAIAVMAKKMKLPIALFRIEGGYGVHPRWSDVIRKGNMRAYVSEVIEPETIADLTNDELMERIEKGLNVDEATAEGEFHSDRRAEYLERAMYVCPYCGLSTFESHGNEIECKKCNRKITYGTDKWLAGNGFEFPFDFVAEWYEYQENFINSLNLLEYTETPVYVDQADVSEVIVYKHKRPMLKGADIRLYGDRIVINEDEDHTLVFPFSEVTAAAVLGKNKLNIYHDKKVYQLKGDKRFNALKYVNFYYRYKNIIKGDAGGKFLGL